MDPAIMAALAAKNKAAKKGKEAAAAAAAPAAAQGGGAAAAAAAAPGKKKKKDEGDDAEALPKLPEAAQQTLQILRAMGVMQFDPQVVPQLLEFSSRYVSDVLEDAHRYAEYRKPSASADLPTPLQVQDVRLAVESRVDFSSAAPPPREFLLEKAEARNAKPLTIPQKFGPLLPHDRYCLLNPNYEVLPKSKADKTTLTGPWEFPRTEAAVRAHEEARRNRKRRRLLDSQGGNEQEDMSEDEDATKAQARTNVDAQVSAAMVARQQQQADEDDDYDA